MEKTSDENIRRIEHMKLYLLIERSRASKRLEELDRQIDELDKNIKFWRTYGQ